MKPIIKFIKHWKKHGWKKTIEKTKYNYVMLDTPEQLLRKEIVGYIGAMGGILFAMVILIYEHRWYISIAMGFSLLILYVHFKKTLKQLQTLKNIKKEFEGRKI